MMILQKKYKQDIGNLLMYVFGFLILWEWLRPLTTIADIGNLSVFVIFMGLCFVLSFSQVRFRISFFVQLIAILFMIHGLYYEAGFLHPSWFTPFLSDFFHNIGLLTQMKWGELSDVFLTLSFFIALSCTSFLLCYWIRRQKRILLFFLLTIIYIAVLDTFSFYNATGAIVRIMIVGFLFLGLLHMKRIETSEYIQKHMKLASRMLTPLIVLILFSTTLGYLAPKAAPQWPDPVPYLQFGKVKAKGAGGSGMNKAGFSSDDSNLGGPFIANDAVVFTAQGQKSNYWRVETKDVYTGKGWEASQKPENRSFKSENTILNWYEVNTKTEDAKATIKMKQDISYFVYPAGLTAIEAGANILYSVNPVLEKISTLQNGNAVYLREYKVSYKFPEFSVEDLKRTHDGESLEDNPSFMTTYTQLPSSLPARVKDLAAEITKNKTNRYDKTLALERYFSDNGFAYETIDVATPGKNQDYVDQFLFDTKRGYCNNFSTSMIVLLRSIGIPSRWVTGYTEGTFEKSAPDAANERIYKITNNNAHSWVEVYFPNYGWIPFEPTKGFTNPTRLINNTVNTPQTNTAAAPRNERAAQQDESTKLKKLMEDESSASTQKKAYAKSSFPWGYAIISVLLIAFIGYFLFTTRVKWYSFFTIFLYKNRTDDAVYEKAYHALLKQLARTGLPRQQGQTLREYAIYVDKTNHSTSMRKLTSSYEKAIYQEGQAAIEWSKSVALWEDLMKATKMRKIEKVL
ncbi:DUF3488 and DUF4129 domain-containing transglutaminase family protein [Microbacteriaceae bacterium 4G12]